ncbi:DUF3854 domain-containing protein [bacterium]|nr:DUF3854 domain-containing protein [bacterium]
MGVSTGSSSVGPTLLAPEHLDKLRGSGLSDATIAASGAYATRLRHPSRGTPAPALILPGFDAAGRRNGYDVARPTRPHVRPNGATAKYLCPTGVPPRAYFPPLPCVREAVADSRRPLLITEGILKALVAAQAGVPCIGLMGVWNWAARKFRPRKLVGDLAGLDWRGRPVVVVFDTDPTRKPGVHHGAAELARVLANDHGADARIRYLPPGPPGADGRPVKQAVDDYIVAHGEAAFRAWVAGACVSPAPAALNEWRILVGAQRVLTWRPGVYLDRSPTGTGKSFADREVLRGRPWQTGAGHGGNTGTCSLTLVPTHTHCQEVVADYRAAGVAAVAFPQLGPETCARHSEAEAVMARGLSFTAALCPECPYRDGCPYWEGLREGYQARHAVATHARAALAMADLAAGRGYVTVHENALPLLRPVVSARGGLLRAAAVARQAASVAGATPLGDYLGILAGVADELEGERQASGRTASVSIPSIAEDPPDGLHQVLNEAMHSLGKYPPEGAVRLLLAAAAGRVERLVVSVCPPPGGKKGKPTRGLTGVLATPLPGGTPVWLNDATAVRDELAAVLGPVAQDKTPSGTLPRVAPVTQIVPRVDVTKGRGEGQRVISQLRGILHDLPHARVGVLTHKRLAEALPAALGAAYAGRVAKVGYFGGGQSRGSNRWVGECDALVVFGTPRVGTEAVRRHLLQLGDVRAALRDDVAWERDYWSGVTVSGRRVTVRTRHYRDRAWHAAYGSLVWGELAQAVGRGRGILPEGIPVYVVTRENLAPPGHEDGRGGYPIADHLFAPLTGPQARVLGALAGGRNRYGWLASPRCHARVIARALQVSPQRAGELLRELAAAGRVVKHGERRGWSLPRNATQPL